MTGLIWHQTVFRAAPGCSARPYRDFTAAKFETGAASPLAGASVLGVFATNRSIPDAGIDNADHRILIGLSERSPN